MSAPRSNRRFFAVVLLVALLIAGVGSFYASNHPDGLNAVAQKTGFIDREKKSPAADGPFGGYQTKGIADDRLSGGVAGVAGCLLVLVIGGSLFWVLRRRGTGGPHDAGDAEGAPESSDGSVGAPTRPTTDDARDRSEV